MNCEMCGRNIEKPIFVSIEGAEMVVCEKCSSHGKIIQKSIKKDSAEKNIPQKKQLIHETRPVFSDEIVKNYGRIIKNAREKAGLTQKEFAKKIAEKESLIHQIETEHIMPKISTARKIEILFNVKLIEKIKNATANFEKSDEKTDSSVKTIGDVLKEKFNFK